MKRKIAIISEHASPLATLGGTDSGGQNVYVDQVAKNLAKLGFIVDVFTRWDNPQLPKIINYYNGVRVIHVKAGPKKFIQKEKLLAYLAEFYQDMLSFMKQEKDPYHLIHANFFMSAEVARLLKKKLGIPFIVTFHALGKVRRLHQGQDDGFSDKRFTIEQAVVNEADTIIAECPQDREDLLYHYHANQHKISIVPCGFDPYEFFPIDSDFAKKTLGLETGTRYILQLGRMVRRKGVDTVIEALSHLLKKTEESVKLLIVGGESDSPDPQQTPEIARLFHIAKKAGVEKNIIFTGRKSREQLKYYYNASDVFVSTPWYEPFGITPLEAMACGTPVIGSKVGGIQFSVLDEKTGFLVPPKDPNALSEKLVQLLSNEKIASMFSENAARRMTTFFTWDTIAKALSHVFEKIMYVKTTRLEEYQPVIADKSQSLVGFKNGRARISQSQVQKVITKKKAPVIKL